MGKIPYIFVFDIDKTILGDVGYILSEHQFNKNIIDMNKELINSKKINYKYDFEKDLLKGLLRPYFIDFLKFCRKKFKKCEFYIYTMSSYEWTNNVLIKIIEKATKIKFSKPYYTRENSIPYKGKSLNYITEHIKKKYNTTEDVSQNIVFIDDIVNNTNVYKNRQIVCPVYENTIYRDIYQNLINVYGEKMLKNSEMQVMFKKYDIPYYDENSKDILANNKEYFEIHKLIKIKEAELYNKKYQNDVFFKKLIEKITDLSNKNIKDINKEIDKIVFQN
jgi:hypothetical protein